MNNAGETPLATDQLAAAYLAAAPDAIVVVDNAGLITLVNRQTEALFGYRTDELVGQSVDMLVGATRQANHAEHRKRYAQDPRTRSMGDHTNPLHGRCKDGTLIPIEVALSPVSSGCETGAVAIVRDIRRRLKAEDRLRSSEAGFRSAFIDAPVAMVLTTDGHDAADEGQGDPQIVEANQAFRLMLGLGSTDLAGTSLAALTFNDADEPATVNADGSVERRYVHRDGHTVWGAVHTSDLLHPLGRTQQLSHIVDITRRVEAERQRDLRVRLLTSLADVRQATLTEQPVDNVLDLILGRVQWLLDVSDAFIAVPSVNGELVYRSVASPSEHNDCGLPVPHSGAIRTVLDTGKPVVASGPGEQDAPAEASGHTFIAPLSASGLFQGILVATRSPGSDPFGDDEIEIGTTLAAEIAVTLDLARARSDRRRMFLIEDRERIARDLHDVVIQRLFAAGMSLQASLGAPSQLRSRAQLTIDELDETIDVIRETIFQLTQPDLSLEGELRRIADRYRTIGLDGVTLDLTGDIASIDDNVADSVSATLSELLSNVERHADASSAQVTLTVDESVTLTVTDDGGGFDHDKPPGFGIRNISQRANVFNGTVTIGGGPDRTGTTVTWQVPVH